MFEKANSGQEQDLISNQFFEFLMLLNGRFFTKVRPNCQFEFFAQF